MTDIRVHPVQTDAAEVDRKKELTPALDPVDEASDESFPASDPPSWTPVQGTGRPQHAHEASPTAPAVRKDVGDEETPERLFGFVMIIFALALIGYVSISLWVLTSMIQEMPQ